MPNEWARARQHPLQRKTRQRTAEDVRSHAGYVQQSDHFMPFLTVYETLRYIALLRTSLSLSEAEKEFRVREIIAELGLRHVSDNKIGGTAEIRGVSGGPQPVLCFHLHSSRRAAAMQYCYAAVERPFTPLC